MHRLPLLSFVALALCGCDAPPPQPGFTLWSPPAAVVLPAVAGNGELFVESTDIWIETGRIVLVTRTSGGGEIGRPILEYDGRIDARHRLHKDPSSLQIQPLSAALGRIGPEVNLFIDRDVSYQTVIDALYTVSMAGGGRFAFAIEDRAHSAVVIAAPNARLAGERPPEGGLDPLGLTVAIDDDRFVLTASRAPLPDTIRCGTFLPAPADRPQPAGCPLLGDLDALSQAAVRIKDHAPEGHTANLTARASTPWSEVLDAAAAIRSVDGQDLLPSVVFAVPRWESP